MLSASRRRLLHLSRGLSAAAAAIPNPTLKKPIASTISFLFKEYDPDRLVSLFKDHSGNPEFRSKQRVYGVVVRRLATARRPDLVESLLEDQLRHVADSSEGFAARLISLYGHAGMPAHAVALFRRLPPLGRPPSALSFNAMLTAFSLAGDTESLADAFREFTSSQDPPIVPNTISYNILILALCEKSQFDAALDALNIMEMDHKEPKIEPNLVTFNTILNAFYQNDRFDDAEKVWARMVERRIDPDIWSFNSKVRGLVAEKRVPEAVELVEQLKSVGPTPDTYTYNALIKGYCLDGNSEEAKRIYKELGKNGCVPNRWTFEILASEFCKVGELDAALKLCRHSISQRCCVGVGVLQEVVDMLARNSRFEEAKRLVEHAKLKSYTRNSLRMPLPCLAL